MGAKFGIEELILISPKMPGWGVIHGIDLLYHHAKFGGAQMLHATERAKCFWPPHLLMTKFVNATSPLSCLNSEIILISLDKGRFVVVHARSHLSLCR